MPSNVSSTTICAAATAQVVDNSTSSNINSLDSAAVVASSSVAASSIRALLLRRSRENTYGYLFFSYRRSHFVQCLVVFLVQFCVAAVTVFASDDSPLLKLFLFGLIWGAHTLDIAAQMPYDQFMTNVRKVAFGLASLAHSTIFLAIQSGGSRSSYFFLLLILFTALVLLLMFRRSIPIRFCGQVPPPESGEWTTNEVQQVGEKYTSEGVERNGSKDALHVTESIELATISHVKGNDGARDGRVISKDELIGMNHLTLGVVAVDPLDSLNSSSHQINSPSNAQVEREMEIIEPKRKISGDEAKEEGRRIRIGSTITEEKGEEVNNERIHSSASLDVASFNGLQLEKQDQILENEDDRRSTVITAAAAPMEANGTKDVAVLDFLTRS